MSDVIALCGKSGAGKDKFAEYVFQRMIHTGYTTVHRLAFADPIRDMLSVLSPMFKTMSEPEFKNTLELWGMDEVTYRKLGQTLGTDWGREMINKQLWTRFLFHRINELSRATPDSLFIITDTRFPDEAEMLLASFNAYIVEIVRPDASPVRQHVSEELDLSKYIDEHVYNNSDLARLDYLADNFVTEYLKGISNDTI